MEKRRKKEEKIIYINTAYSSVIKITKYILFFFASSFFYCDAVPCIVY
jgi:hypothetical protein